MEPTGTTKDIRNMNSAANAAPRPRRRRSAILAIIATILVGIGMVASPAPPSKTTLIIRTAKGLSDSQGQDLASKHGGSWKRSIPKLGLQIIEVSSNAKGAIKNSLKG